MTYTINHGVHPPLQPCPSIVQAIRDEAGDDKPAGGILAELVWYREKLAEHYEAATLLNLDGMSVHEAEQAVNRAKAKQSEIKQASDWIRGLIINLMSIIGGVSNAGPDIITSDHVPQPRTRRIVGAGR